MSEQSNARLIAPRITVLVTSVDRQGNVNAAPYSWIMPISFKPAMLCVAIQKRNTRTLKNIKATKEFVVNIVEKKFAKQAVNCAKCFEWNEDKLARENLAKENSEKVSVPRVAEASIALECKLVEIIEPKKADHYLITAEIVNSVKKKEIDKLDVIMHYSGNLFCIPGEKLILEE